MMLRSQLVCRCELQGLSPRLRGHFAGLNSCAGVNCKWSFYGGAVSGGGLNSCAGVNCKFEGSKISLNVAFVSTRVQV